MVDAYRFYGYNTAMKNIALIFIKPHAAGEKSASFILQFLAEKGIDVLSKGKLTAEEIDSQRIVDRHYFAIAAAAVNITPDELVLTDEAKGKFSTAFQGQWDQNVAAGKILNCAQARERLGEITGRELNELWKAGLQTKLAPGMYVAWLPDLGFYLVNGFYLGMRDLFTTPGGMILWYIVEFDPAELSWKSFRAEVIGATDPAAAAGASLRKILLNRWKELGHPYPPTMTENGIHASAGPLEGLRERIVWSGTRIDQDPFAQELLSAGLYRSRLEELLENPIVTLDTETGPVFDLTEDMDSRRAVALLANSHGDGR